MAKLEHLPLPRLEGQLDRKKGSGFPSALTRDVPTHAATLSAQITAITTKRDEPGEIAKASPLLLQVRSVSPIGADEWPRVDMQILATDPRNTVVLFASDSELTKFRARMEGYRGPIPAGNKGHQHAGFFDPIEEITERQPVDRLGPVLKRNGHATADSFVDGQRYTLDFELYRPADEYVGSFCSRIEMLVEGGGGHVLSQYRGSSMLLMRIDGPASLIRDLLTAAEVLEADLPAQPDVPPVNITDIQIDAGIKIENAPLDAAVIGIVDSGLTSAHPFIAGSVKGTFGSPPTLGDADEWGHGTSVAGLAALGDIRPMLDQKLIRPRFQIASARVLKADGGFDDIELVPQQMDGAIRRLHDEFGCKVINISLGDPSRPIDRKPSAWAATLDQLARELDLVIVVSAGNRKDVFATYGEDIVSEYPKYLLDAENRIVEPASAANAITVGSIALSNGTRVDDDIAVRMITEANEPSPFSRVGPGVAKILKPDFVDHGGTCIFDGGAQRLLAGEDRVEAGIVCLSPNYLQRLLTTRCGTSLSAPLVAHKAAILWEAYPDKSANFVRALLALSAEVPPATKRKLANYSLDDVLNIAGYGVPNIDNALASEDNRVVLFDEFEVGVDRFVMYALPVPKAFQSTNGRRRIDIALAFDPPTRRTRDDYLGHTMSFDLYRGMTPQDVIDVCRKRKKSEGKAPKTPGRFRCNLEPKIILRGSSTLQRASFVGEKNVTKFGDTYHLVVRCESGWAATDRQRFAVAVEMRHEADIQLHARLQERIRIRL